MSSISRIQVLKHVGHNVSIGLVAKEDASIYCINCDEVVWKTDIELERRYRNAKLKIYWSKMKIENPEKYREINNKKNKRKRLKLG